MPFEKLSPLPEPGSKPGRRLFLQKSASYMGLAAAASLGAPTLVAAQSVRPQLPYGLQLGDTTIVSAGRRSFNRDDDRDDDDAGRSGSRGLHARSIFWARSDKPARMVLEWDTSDRFCQPAQNHRPVCAGGDRFHRPRGPNRSATGPAHFYPRGDGRLEHGPCAQRMADGAIPHAVARRAARTALCVGWRHRRLKFRHQYRLWRHAYL